MLSNCCNSTLITHQSDEGTGYYSCKACGRACDPNQNDGNLPEEADQLVKLSLEIGLEAFCVRVEEALTNARREGYQEGLLAERERNVEAERYIYEKFSEKYPMKGKLARVYCKKDGSLYAMMVTKCIDSLDGIVIEVANQYPLEQLNQEAQSSEEKVI